MTKSRHFAKESDLGIALEKWWSSLESNKGQRAELKRCHSVSELYACPAAHRVWRQSFAEHGLNADKMLLTIGLLSHVRNHSNESLGKQLAGTSPKRSRAALSELRFRRLLQTDDPESLFSAMRRVISLTDKTSNIYELARLAYRWQSPISVDQARKELAYDYYEFFKN